MYVRDKSNSQNENVVHASEIFHDAVALTIAEVDAGADLLDVVNRLRNIIAGRSGQPT